MAARLPNSSLVQVGSRQERFFGEGRQLLEPVVHVLVGQLPQDAQVGNAFLMIKRG